MSARLSAEPASTSLVGPEVAPAGERHHQGGRGQAADESDPPGGQHRQRETERGGGDHRQVGTGVHAEGVRRGQGVAGDRLQGRPGGSERDPDQDPGEQPGQPGGDHHRGGVVGAPAGDHAPHVGGVHRGGALGDVDHGEQRDGGQPQHRHGGDPQWAERPGCGAGSGPAGRRGRVRRPSSA
ncbi:MAG TPA: hypothetical protein VHH34_09580 [Pseudonocardiaceae bacterium]|nr:hypothetical protein [Pseudonocardiaceae bacterium]